MSRRYGSFITLAIAIAYLFLGPSVAFAQQSERSITVAESGNIASLDPTLYSETAPINLALNIGDPLVAVQDGEIVGVLAETWESPSPDHYILHLRRDVVFHDGTPFTAADVEFTLERILDPETRSGLLPYIALIEEVQAVDDYTVDIKLSEPQVTFLYNLSRGVVMISKQAFEALGAETFGERPVATGPFMVRSWDRTSSWVLEANPQYWRGRPEIDVVTFRVIPEVSTQLAGLLAGDIDITSSIGYETADLVERSPGVRVEMATGLFQEMIVLDTTKPPLDDVRVRRALNHAIDVDEIIAGVYQGRGQRTTHPFTSAVFGYNPNIEPYQYDPELARQLLQEAGYGEGFTIDLIYPAGGGSTGAMGRLAEVVASYFAEVGVTVRISAPERIEHGRRVYSQGTMEGMAIAQLINRVGDADFGIALYFDESRRDFWFKDPGLVGPVRAQLEATDREARLEILQELAVYLHDQAPWVYIAEVPLLYGVNDDLEWTARADQTIQIYGARFR